MRSLLVLGGFALCVLLVTASNSDQKEPGNNPQDEGGEKEISDLTEVFGQNEDGRDTEAHSVLAIDWQAQPRFRRHAQSQTSKPAKNKKKCVGCFTTLVVKDGKGRQRRKVQKKEETNPSINPPSPGIDGATAMDEVEPSRPPGGEGRRGKKKKKNGGKHRSEEPSRPPGGEGRRGKKKKKNGGKHRSEEGEEGKRRLHIHRHQHPEGEKEEKKKRRSGSLSFVLSSPDVSRDGYLSSKKEAVDRTKRQSDNRKTESELKNKRRTGTKSLITIVSLSGKSQGKI